ncbi:NfeD family protein [Acetivibrio clariflavus]|uniref:Membrane-bound serine protease (ClpP class) n=1 Tax=Acetivibrio clariflavus (strain DSM 19732 / NBRC 101661 / EBR45) TaxID=720554 RepID=G8M0F8_ACECE|nr:NfeD family protein [Acetivibrio clariflavus]AEV68003.1 membrane-bound serine protease (ClpP class) [Acetivibrio clariflavus DSM 19732]
MPDLVGLFSNIDFLSAVFFILGFIMIIIEMFHPGFGAPGISGIILLILGIVSVARNLTDVIILIIIILIVLGIALTFVLYSATKGKLPKTLVLTDSLNKEEGFEGTEDLKFFIGKEGKALTVLRPSGTADFDGVKLDVVSEAEFIQKDAKIKIIKVEGRRIVVREIK